MEHIALYKANNKTVKTSFRENTHARTHARARTHTHTHTHTHTLLYAGGTMLSLLSPIRGGQFCDSTNVAESDQRRSDL